MFLLRIVSTPSPFLQKWEKGLVSVWLNNSAKTYKDSQSPYAKCLRHSIYFLQYHVILRNTYFDLHSRLLAIAPKNLSNFLGASFVLIFGLWPVSCHRTPKFLGISWIIGASYVQLRPLLVGSWIASGWGLVIRKNIVIRSLDISAPYHFPTAIFWRGSETELIIKHAQLFTIANTWKQPKPPSTAEWVWKMRNIFTMEYYSAIKKNEIMPLIATWTNLEIIMLSEVS